MTPENGAKNGFGFSFSGVQTMTMDCRKAAVAGFVVDVCRDLASTTDARKAEHERPDVVDSTSASIAPSVASEVC